MGAAAHAIGNTELEDLFAKALDMLERPNTVVFNPSYVSLISFRMMAELIVTACICRKRVLGYRMSVYYIAYTRPGVIKVSSLHAHSCSIWSNGRFGE